MKNKILIIFTYLILFASKSTFAQPPISYGLRYTSTTFSFNPNDSLNHYIFSCSGWSEIIIDTAIHSSSNSRLWQIGNTNKPYFSDTNSVHGIMTDTLNPYPINANSWFILKGSNYLFKSAPSEIVTIIHKYNTTKGKDGGIIEISIDSGNTWKNIIEWNLSCFDSSNFYTNIDTLKTGEAAFSGNSNGWMVTQFEFTTIACTSNQQIAPLFFVRFRFISDSIPDTLSGWLIKSINIENDILDAVQTIKNSNQIVISPNPFSNQINITNAPSGTNIKVYDVVGRLIYNGKLDATHVAINTSTWEKGTYFVELLGEMGRVVRKVVK
jgi:hypothetical protein